MRNAYVSKIINQNLLKHIKKLENEKKSMTNTFKELVAKEASKSPDVAIQTEEANIKTTNLAVQANPNLIEVKTYSEVVVQTEDTSNKDSVVKSTTTMPGGNQQTLIQTLKEVQTRKTPYLHPNHKSRHLNQSTNLHHSKHKQQTYVTKNTKVSSIRFIDNNLLQNSSNQKIPQKVNLGWSNPFSVRQCYISFKVLTSVVNVLSLSLLNY